jgi:hypothetical protein
MGCVFGMQIMQPFHVIDERISDITVWSSIREKQMATTAVGAFNENRIPTIQFLSFCQNGGKVYNDGIFSFPELKNGSQFRAISSMDGYVLLGTSKSGSHFLLEDHTKIGRCDDIKANRKFPNNCYNELFK